MKLLAGLMSASLLLIFIPVCLGARGRYAQKLFRDLFVNYTSALRPVDNTDHVINVTLQVTLSQIIDMDERNQILTLYLWVRQVWIDSFLTWSKDDYDGLDSIRIPSRYVWKPDIVLYNSADDEFSSSMETNVVLRSDGQVTWDQPSITKSSCSVDVAYFPFDLQQCILTYGSWTYNGNQMDLHIEMGADLADLVPNVEWQVLGMPAKKNVILYGCCSDPYPDITFTLQLKRRASFYIFNLLLPCMMISFLAPLGFYLPADSGEKVSLGVTVLLALTVFQLLVAESMPPSESVPLIGKYYIATMTMVTASTALTIFIMNLHHCGPEARPVPDWVRVVVLKYLNRLCLVYELGETCTRENPTTESQEDNSERGSWEVSDDHHVALTDGKEENCKQDELSVTIESPENDHITAQRVERLMKAKNAMLNSTIHNESQQGFRVKSSAYGQENGNVLGKGQLSDESCGPEGVKFKMVAVKSQAEEREGTKTDESFTVRKIKSNNGGKQFEGENEEQSETNQQLKCAGQDLVQHKKESEDRGELSKAGRGPDVDILNLNDKIEPILNEASKLIKSPLKMSEETVGNNIKYADSDKSREEKKMASKDAAFPDDAEFSRRYMCCHCCRHYAGRGGRGGLHSDSPGCVSHGEAAGCSGLHGNVASIAASFQEQRMAQALMADWRKVAKVMDRALMWIFFIMVFIMSVLILGKAI